MPLLTKEFDQRLLDIIHSVFVVPGGPRFDWDSDSCCFYSHFHSYDLCNASFSSTLPHKNVEIRCIPVLLWDRSHTHHIPSFLILFFLSPKPKRHKSFWLRRHLFLLTHSISPPHFPAHCKFYMIFIAALSTVAQLHYAAKQAAN